ncbi:hypothetical protein TWF173_001391 [Orbilia oligospora]|nr:hypothetical protein TWF173_001391 [Orbilia oligospora]
MSQMSKFISGTDILNPLADPRAPCESELGCFRGRFISPPRYRAAAGRQKSSLHFATLKGQLNSVELLCRLKSGLGPVRLIMKELLGVQRNSHELALLASFATKII